MAGRVRAKLEALAQALDLARQERAAACDGLAVIGRDPFGDVAQQIEHPRLWPSGSLPTGAAPSYRRRSSRVARNILRVAPARSFPRMHSAVPRGRLVAPRTRAPPGPRAGPATRLPRQPSPDAVAIRRRRCDRQAVHGQVGVSNVAELRVARRQRREQRLAARRARQPGALPAADTGEIGVRRDLGAVEAVRASSVAMGDPLSAGAAREGRQRLFRLRHRHRAGGARGARARPRVRGSQAGAG